MAKVIGRKPKSVKCQIKVYSDCKYSGGLTVYISSAEALRIIEKALRDAIEVKA